MSVCLFGCMIALDAFQTERACALLKRWGDVIGAPGIHAPAATDDDGPQTISKRALNAVAHQAVYYYCTKNITDVNRAYVQYNI